MANLVPLTIELEESIHRAVRLRAAKDGMAAADLVLAILRKALAAEIEEVCGVPSLAAMIQSHHNRQQGVPRPPHQPPGAH